MASVELGELLSRFRRLRVLVIGDLMLDEYISGDCSRISLEAPVPVVKFTGFRTVPGGAANTAANVASLGARATLIGLAGDDQAGRELARACAAADVRFIPLQDGEATTRKVRVIAHQQQLVRLDYERTRRVDRDLEDRILAEFGREVTEADVVVVSDYAKGLLTQRLCQEVIAGAHAVGKKVIVDPRPEHAAFYESCDYLTPNWKEAQGLLGRVDTGCTDEAIAGTAERLGARFRSNVLLTLGSRGIAFFGLDPREQFLVPAVAKEVFDVSGAGDTVVATFAAAIAAGSDHHAAVRLANRAAGIVVGKQGTATVTAEELITDSLEARVLGREALRGVSRLLKSRGKRVVTVNGTFDLLHVGHLHILQEAKRQGDVLIVGLNSDASVRTYKGPTRPIVGQAERATMLLALRCVDYVHIFDEPVPMPFLDAVQPDVHVNGAEYGADCIEAEAVRMGGGRLHLVERIEGFATSDVLQKISKTAAQTPS